MREVVEVPEKVTMLEWNVYLEDNGHLTRWDIFSHSGFRKGCAKAYRHTRYNRREFLDLVEWELKYWFWCKCEYEVLIVQWPPNEKGPKWKVDVYDQVLTNWAAFAEYIWTHRTLLLTEEDEI